MDHTIIVKITKSGFGNKMGQIPLALKVPLLLFDYFNSEDIRKKKPQTIAIKKHKTNASYRCPREGMVPFDAKGRLTKWAKDDGVPALAPSIEIDGNGKLQKTPLYLVLSMQYEKLGTWVGPIIKALAVIYPLSDFSLKLEYLCAAPKFKGAGTELLKTLRQGKIFKPMINDARNLLLNNNSEIPGYYEKRGFQKVGQTNKGKYFTWDREREIYVDKFLNIYKASLPSDNSIYTPNTTKKIRRKSALRLVSPAYQLRTRAVPRKYI
jgi:hypothetical protein